MLPSSSGLQLINKQLFDKRIEITSSMKTQYKRKCTLNNEILTHSAVKVNKCHSLNIDVQIHMIDVEPKC